MKKLLFLFLFLLPLPASAATCSVNSSSVGTNDTFGDYVEALAVQFTVAAECDVGSVTLNLAKDSGATDNARISFYSDSGNQPNVLIGTADTFPAAPVFPTFADRTASPTACLQPGTNYWLVLDKPGSSSGNEYYVSDSNGAPTMLYKYLHIGTWFGISTREMIYSIEDGGTACGGPSPSPASTSTVWTFSTTTTLIDNPTEQMFDGMLLFLASMGLMYFMLKK